MKVIGIVGRVYKNIDNQNVIQVNDCIRKNISKYEDVVSMLLLPVSNISYHNIDNGSDIVDRKRLDYLLDLCDGFIVPGGTNWYNFDEYIVKYAINKKKPLLGICLGFQCICSMFSINRERYDMTKRLNNDNHYGKENEYKHKIKILDNTILKKILKCNEIMVNSLHHDYVDFPLNELSISALSYDNVIEAVELDNHPFFIALQWHPEYLDDLNSKKIFDCFIETIKKLPNH